MLSTGVFLTFRLPLNEWVWRNLKASELSGALGDLGTFIPLYINMVAAGALDPVSGLFFAGLQNFITGLTFSVPMPVQPMKAIAAAAVAQGLTRMEVAGGAVLVGVVVSLLGITNLILLFNRLCPLAVIRGIQLGLGLSLAQKGQRTIQAALEAAWTAKRGTVDLGLGLGGLVVVLLLLPHLHHQRVPIALVYLALGVVYALVDSHGHGVALGLHWPLRPLASEWDWGQLLQGFLVAGLPQLPLTTLNSIVAVVSLSDELFRRPCDAPHSPASPDPLAPPAPHPEERYAQPVEDLEAAPGPDGGAAADSLVRLPTLRSVAVSVGLLNLGSVWFGSMPMCHGCGGLASQYLFGARTQMSVLMLGTAKMTLAVLLGPSLLTLFRHFPPTLLATFLLVSGLELATTARDISTKLDMTVMCLTVVGSLASNSLSGFVVGMLAHFLLGAGSCLLRRSAGPQYQPAAANLR